MFLLTCWHFCPVIGCINIQQLPLLDLLRAQCKMFIWPISTCWRLSTNTKRSSKNYDCLKMFLIDHSIGPIFSCAGKGCQLLLYLKIFLPRCIMGYQIVSCPGLVFPCHAHFLILWESLKLKREHRLCYCIWHLPSPHTSSTVCCIPIFKTMSDMLFKTVKYVMYVLYLKVISLLISFGCFSICVWMKWKAWRQRWETRTTAPATTITTATTTTTLLLLKLLLETRRFPTLTFKVTNPQPLSSLSPSIPLPLPWSVPLPLYPFAPTSRTLSPLHPCWHIPVSLPNYSCTRLV